MRLSKNFSLREFIKSDTATRLDINNVPSQEVIDNLKLLCENVLQPLREHYAKPIVISSGYRSPELNSTVGGSKTSDHCQGFAADINALDGDNGDLYEAIIDLDLEFKQLIHEYGDENNPDWIHISYDESNNKGQKLRAIRRDGQTTYMSIFS